MIVANSYASRTAIAVVDMQNDFCSAEGALARLGVDISVNLEVARRIPNFLEVARDCGVLIVWVHQSAREDLVSNARRARARAMHRNAMSVAAASTWGAELFDGLIPEPRDSAIYKSRYSAFVGTPLHNLMRANERDNLVVCGTAANVCVDSTIRDAYMADYEVSMPSDLVGWTRGDLAESAIENLGIYFCEVTTSDEILARFVS